MKKGRVQYLVQETGLIWKIDDDIQIFADQNQFTLRFRNDPSYFADLPDLFDWLFKSKAKELMIASK